MLSIILIAEDIKSIKKFFKKLNEEKITIRFNIFAIVQSSDPSLLLILEKEGLPNSHIVFGNGELSISECINRVCSLDTETELFLLCPDNSLITFKVLERIQQEFSNPNVGLVIPQTYNSNSNDDPFPTLINKDTNSRKLFPFRLHTNSIFCFSKASFRAANRFDTRYKFPFFLIMPFTQALTKRISK